MSLLSLSFGSSPPPLRDRAADDPGHDDYYREQVEDPEVVAEVGEWERHLLATESR
jgi:hypothetical protein